MKCNLGKHIAMSKISSFEPLYLHKNNTPSTDGLKKH